MVVGLDKFRQYFGEFPDHYTIIGGAACDLLFNNAGLPFRATKDIDLVLCVEIIEVAFAEKFREFLDAGGYQAREQSDGHREFYRFHKPQDTSFPFMIEVFSRGPNEVSFPADAGIVTLKVEADIVSLSAILLDPEYFEAMQNGKVVVDGVTILSESVLIPFKAKAFLDLTERRAKGETVKGNDIKKHRNDVFRLSQLLRENEPIEISETMRGDMRKFLTLVSSEDTVDPKSFGVQMSREEAIKLLREAYGVE